MRQHEKTSAEKAERERKRQLPLILLFLLALTTSGIVGFILGRSSSPTPLGQVIDTIPLAPGQEAGEQTFHLTGRVFYSDGTPAAGRRLELHSDPVVTVTDSRGGFFFPNAPQGEHTIYVLDEKGETAAQCQVKISRDGGADHVSVAAVDDGNYVIQMAVDVRVLEIEVQLNSNTISINPDRLTYATKDGRVVTPAGTVSIRDGVVVTPGGNVYLPDGSIVLPGGETGDTTYIIQADDAVLVDQPLTVGDMEIAADGTVTLPDDTVIQPGGIITDADGVVGQVTPGESGVILGGGIVASIGDQSQGSPTGDGDNLPAKQPGDGGKEDPASQPGSGQAGQSGSGQTGQPGSGQTGQPGSGQTGQSGDGQPGDGGQSESPGTPGDTGSTGDGGGLEKPGSGSGGGHGGGDRPATDNGNLQVSGETRDGSFTSWEQDSVIDLFYNRTTGEGEKIQPGSGGYYLFRLENGRKEKLIVTLTITEADGSPHLPLQFELRPRNQRTGGVTGSLTAGDPLVLRTEVGGKSDVVYRLDWEWPFDSGDDGTDTAAGRQGGLYTLKMSIRAEGDS